MPGTRCGGFASSLRTSQSSVRLLLASGSRENREPRRQVIITQRKRAGQHQRQPAALDDLQHVGREEHLLDHYERQHQAKRPPDRPAPQLPDHEEGHHAVDDHRSRDRHAVSGGERLELWNIMTTSSTAVRITQLTAGR